MSRLTLLASLSAAFILALLFQPAGADAQAAAAQAPPQELLRLSMAAETPGLAEPFKGITTNGQIEAGLFKIRSTGVSTSRCAAAEKFLAGLTESQRNKTRFAIDDAEWRKWMNQSFYVRQGVSFMEMTPAQRDTAFGLFRAGLSAKGLKLTRDIMRLNETLAELTDNNFDEYGEWQYYVTVMGTPSATEPWGWQLDGHHVIVNYFVLGDQVVMTPFFAGSEPVTATSGKYRGTTVLQDEQNKALAFDQSARRAAARQGGPEGLEDRRREPHRGLERQRRARLRRRPRHGALGGAATAAAGSDRAVRRQHGRRACAREDGRGARASGSHVVRLDRQDRARQRLLLPDSQPGNADRVRSSASGRHATPSRTRRCRRASTFTPWCGRRTGTTTARICCGSITCSTLIRQRLEAGGLEAGDHHLLYSSRAGLTDVNWIAAAHLDSIRSIGPHNYPAPVCTRASGAPTRRATST